MTKAPIVAFFNNKGGVGKTSLAYHLAWMFADLGKRVLAVDLDPQANLTAAFLTEDRLAELWQDDGNVRTVYGSILPLLKGTGDVAAPVLEDVSKDVNPSGEIALMVGDLALSGFEDQLSENWPKALDGQERAFRVLSAFWRLIQAASENHRAAVALMDLGPNLGAINRAALVAADFVVVPLAPDLFSLQGLRNLGPALRKWREDWKQRLKKNPAKDLPLPRGHIRPAGYVLLQHAVRLDRPTRAYDEWAARIPETYLTAVLDQPGGAVAVPEEDPHCLALLKHYRSLMPMAQEARKPIFHLKASDGAMGAHFKAVQDARRDFERIARKVAQATGVTVPG